MVLLDENINVPRILNMTRMTSSAAGPRPTRAEPTALGLPSAQSGSTERPAGASSQAPAGAELTALFADLRSTLGELKCLGSERLRRLGVSMGHLHAMALLERHGRLSMSRFAELLDVSLSNATGLVDRMAERGLVERIRVPDDRRVVLVELTDLGRRLLEEMDLLRDDLLARVLGQLEPEHLAALTAAVARLRDAVRELALEVRLEADVHPAGRSDQPR